MKKYLLTLSVTLVSLTAVLLSGCEKNDKDAITMEAVNKGIEIIIGDDGKEYQVVNLGTGVLWAVCNIGASSPEQTGSLFAWGEKTPKQSFSWSNYEWNDGNNPPTLTKYNEEDTTALFLADDVAYSVIGEKWRIPEDSDFRSLLTKRNCTSKWCKLNGVGGFLFTSVKKGYEGNSIFIPLAGMLDHTTTRFAGEYGWYWCNTLYYDTTNKKYIYTQASTLSLQHGEIDNHTIEFRTRNVGLPIRPIYIGE